MTSTSPSARKQEADLKTYCLHRYFIQADEMKQLFDRTLNKGTTFDDPEHLLQFIYMGMWYGSLYVVVEGWSSLNLSDPLIEELLSFPHTRSLRRYRNCIFHYQPTYYDERVIEFMREDTPAWVHRLHAEFGRYFLNWLSERRSRTE